MIEAVIALVIIAGGLYGSLIALDKYAQHKAEQEKKEHKCNCGHCKCHNHDKHE